MRALNKYVALCFAAVLLSGCSFHLRGQAGMPFTTLYLDSANPESAFTRELRRDLAADKVKLVNSAEHADVVLNIVSEIPDKQILSLSGSGRVNEYQLFYTVSMRAYDLKRQVWIPAEDIVMHREYTYDDNNILAMEAEEDLLYQSMRTDMAQRIMRRLSRSKPQPQ